MPRLCYLFDENNIYAGPAETTPGDIGGSYYRPANATETPPGENGEAAKPGDWRWDWTAWVAVTAGEKIAAIEAKIQARLDDFARERGYDDLLSAVSYASSADTRFAAEGQTAIRLRSETWQAWFELLAEMGDEIPAWAEIEAKLPELEWGE